MTRKTRNLLVALSAVVMLVAAAGAAYGFTDDGGAGGDAFVTAANALKGAGCASGFGDGSFGYNAGVTRGQDAIFHSACFPGSAYVNNSNAAAVTVGSSPATLASVTITAGINPGGVQFLQVFAAATLNGNSAFPSVTPGIVLTPPAGGAAANPPVIVCRNVVAAPESQTQTQIVCNGASIVPTGESFTVAFEVVSSGTTAVNPGTLSVITTPRGNTANSARLA